MHARLVGAQWATIAPLLGITWDHAATSFPKMICQWKRKTSSNSGALCAGHAKAFRVGFFRLSRWHENNLVYYGSQRCREPPCSLVTVGPLQYLRRGSSFCCDSLGPCSSCYLSLRRDVPSYRMWQRLAFWRHRFVARAATSPSDCFLLSCSCDSHIQQPILKHRCVHQLEYAVPLRCHYSSIVVVLAVDGCAHGMGSYIVIGGM